MVANEQTDQLNENRRAVYQQLCHSYCAIDDFRSKLLGFLPLISGAGISVILTAEDKNDIVENLLPAIGLFGFFVTLGLFCFELYGIKKCTALIGAGEEIEKELHVEQGQFSKRPLGFIGIINEPFASGVIYSTVLAAWGFFAFDYTPCENISLADLSIAINEDTNAFRIFLGFFLFSLVYDIYLSKDKLYRAWRSRYAWLKRKNNDAHK